MAGRFMDEMPGMSFGHAGTIVEGKEDTATEKIARLAEAGIVVAEEIAEIPDLVKEQAREWPHERADGTFIDVEVDDAVARRRGARHEARGGLPGRHLRRRRRRAFRSSRRTSTSASCAACASTPRRPAPSR